MDPSSPLARNPRNTPARLLWILAASAGMLGTPSAVTAVTGPWQENEPSRVRLVSPWAEAPRIDELRLGLEFELQPGWHVYWKNSGDAGYPPVLDFSATPGVSGWELLWPAPERYELRGGLVAFGYHDQVIYPVRVRLDEGGTPVGSDPSPSTRTFSAELDYVVCEVDCIPYSYSLSLDQPLAGAGAQPLEGAEAESIEHWWSRLPHSLDDGEGVDGGGREGIPEGVTTRGELELEGADAPRLVVKVGGVAGGDEEPQIFLESHELFETGRPIREPTEDGVRFTVPLSFREVPEELPSATEMAWTVTGLRTAGGRGGRSGSGTFAVEARRTVRAAGAAEGAEETEPRDGARGAPPPAGVSGPSPLDAFVAGLLLALTPPLLVLFALRLLASGRLAVPGIRRAALASVVGALLGFGGVAVTARAVGLPTWGAQLQEPVLVTSLVLANLALAFIAWGLLGASTGAASPTQRDHPRPEIPGFAAGLLTVFLALGGSVPGLGFEPAAMLAAGLGASMPYLLLAAAPVLALGFRKVAGRYRLKEALGFLALVGVVWLLYVLTGLVTPEDLALIELMLLVLGLLAWGRKVVERRALSRLLGLLLLAGAFYVLYLAHPGGEAAGIA